jgi:hypothetical protein
VSKSDEVSDGMSASDYERLADAFENLARSLDVVRSDFTLYRSRMRWAAVVGIVAVAVILSGMIAVVAISRSNNEVVDAIRDCTEPGGQCYEANAKRSDARLGPFRVMICDATPPERRGQYCPK